MLSAKQNDDNSISNNNNNKHVRTSVNFDNKEIDTESKESSMVFREND
jgi:hypothetical protein